MEAKNNILNDTILVYDSGNVEEFKNIATKIYDSCAIYPCPLEKANNKYLLGTIFSYFAPFTSININYYTTTIENAYYCLANTIYNSESISEKQCAAIRLLLLIHDNKDVMIQITKQFVDEHMNELYKSNDTSIRVLRQIMGNAHDEDILRMIGGFLISKYNSYQKTSFISICEMEKYNKIVKSNKYNTNISLTLCNADIVFDLMYKYFTNRIRTPYDRRMTPIYNIFTKKNRLFD